MTSPSAILPKPITGCGNFYKQKTPGFPRRFFYCACINDILLSAEKFINRLDAVANMQLFVNVVNVFSHRLRADEQQVRDLFV